MEYVTYFLYYTAHLQNDNKLLPRRICLFLLNRISLPSSFRFIVIYLFVYFLLA